MAASCSAKYVGDAVGQGQRHAVGRHHRRVRHVGHARGEVADEPVQVLTVCVDSTFASFSCDGRLCPAAVLSARRVPRWNPARRLRTWSGDRCGSGLAAGRRSAGPARVRPGGVGPLGSPPVRLPPRCRGSGWPWERGPAGRRTSGHRRTGSAYGARRAGLARPGTPSGRAGAANGRRLAAAEPARGRSWRRSRGPYAVAVPVAVARGLPLAARRAWPPTRVGGYPPTAARRAAAPTGCARPAADRRRTTARPLDDAVRQPDQGRQSLRAGRAGAGPGPRAARPAARRRTGPCAGRRTRRSSAGCRAASSCPSSRASETPMPLSLISMSTPPLDSSCMATWTWVSFGGEDRGVLDQLGEQVHDVGDRRAGDARCPAGCSA